MHILIDSLISMGEPIPWDSLPFEEAYALDNELVVVAGILIGQGENLRAFMCINERKHYPYERMLFP